MAERIFWSERRAAMECGSVPMNECQQEEILLTGSSLTS